LADRFQLKTHWEIREMPVYDLVVAKGGPKLKASTDASLLKPPQTIGMPSPSGAVTLKITQPSMAIAGLGTLLQGYAGRPVKDKTNLTGNYEIVLQFVFEASLAETPVGAPSASDPSGPSIFTAVQEQLGLKLESARGPVEVLVIDSVSRPTEN
jgi:uncharacterized protein (TIGR03435 family)